MSRQALAQPPEPAMDHDPDSPDRAEPAQNEAPEPTAPPKTKGPGLLATVLKLASKIPLPSLGSERHEMVIDASPAPAPAHHAASPPKRSRPRFPLLALSRETRVGLAAVISFGVVVGCLVVKKGWIGGGKQSGTLLAMQKPGEGDHPTPGPDDKDKDKDKNKKDPKAEHDKSGPFPAPAEVTPPIPEPSRSPEHPIEEPPALPPKPVEDSKPPAPDMVEPPVIPPTLPPPEGSKPTEPQPSADAPPMLPDPSKADAPPALPEPSKAETPGPMPSPGAPPELPMTPTDSKPKEEPNPAPVLAPDRVSAGNPTPSSEPPAMPTSGGSPQAQVDPAPMPIPSPAPSTPIPPLETVPAAPSTVESSATKASIAGALGAGWVAIPSGGRRIVGSVPIISTPAEARAEALRVADGPPVADDPAAADQIEPVVHVVQPGENFWTISKLYYRSGRFYKALHAANRAQVPDIRQLWVGTVLRIPPPEALDRAMIDPPTDATASTVSRISRPKAPEAEEADLAMPARPRRVVPDPEAPATAAPRRPTYKVKPHETLRSIARDTLNDPRRDREIYNLNRDVLDDINVLPAGTTLTLPEDASVGRRVSSGRTQD